MRNKPSAESRDRLQLWISALGFYSICGFCILYSVLTRSFAQLKISSPIGVPIFVGEVLLAFCFVLAVILLSVVRPKYEKWHGLLVFFGLWILLKTAVGLLMYDPSALSPLALRNAALFYYSFFAVFMYLFYRKEFFTPKLVLIYLLLLLFVKFFLSINNYFVFPYLILGLVCLISIEKKALRWLLLIPVLYVPTYYFIPKTFTTFDFFFQGGRARVVGHVVAFAFLVIIAVVVSPFKKTYKIMAMVLSACLLLTGIYHFADRNSLKSMIFISDGIKKYREYKELIAQKSAKFEPQPLHSQIYSKEEVGLKESVSNFIQIEYSSKSEVFKKKIQELEEISLEIEKKKTQSVEKFLAEAESEKQAEIKRMADELEASKDKEIRKAHQLEKEKASVKAAVKPSVNDPARLPVVSDKTSVSETIEDKYEQLKTSRIAAIQKKYSEKIHNEADAIRQKRVADIGAAIKDKGMENTVTVNEFLNKMEDNDGRGYRTLDIAYSNMFFRLFIWEDMIKEVIQQKAFFGVSFARPQRSHSLEVLGWAYQEWSRDGWVMPHNSFLHFIYRGGVIGVLFIALMVTLLMRIIKFFFIRKSWPGLLLASLIIYGMTISNFLVFLEIPYTAIPFWTVFGATIAYMEDLKKKKSPLSKNNNGISPGDRHMNWSKKKVLVTGADGFIGSHLVEHLVRKGAEVRAFVYYNSFNSWGWLDQFSPSLLKKIDVFTGDIRDPNGVLESAKGRQVIFHLAALIGIPFSYHSPDSYIDTNIKGTLNILQAARKLDVEKVLHTSTSEVYGTAQYAPIDEKHPINPQSPYAATKSAADSLALSFYRSFDLPVAVVRPFNTFGPRQSARAIIPTIISQIYAGQKTINLGNLEATRDLNYVQNTVDGFVRIAESDHAIGEVFNVGSGREISIRDLVALISRLTQTKVAIKSEKERLRPQKSEVERLICDAGKLKELCGFEPKISLEAGLELTCRWIKDHLKHFKTGIYNV